MNAVLHIGLTHYVVLAATLFVLGLLVMSTRRNAIGVLLGVELILNAAGLNFVAFARYGGATVDGQIAAVFIILLAAAEAAVALAIVLNLYAANASIDVDAADALKG